VEHKLYSPEGKGQLAKYLALDAFDAVAFVTAYASDISPEVLEDPRYARPSGPQPHFLWSDFYDLLENGAGSALTSPLRSLFDHLNFQPPTAAVGDLNTMDEEVRQRERANFMKLYAPLAAALRDRGWKHEISTPPRMDRVGPSGSAFTLLAVEPIDAGRTIRLRLYTGDEELRDRSLSELARLRAAYPAIRIGPHTSSGAKPARRHVADIRIPLTDLSDARDAPALMADLQRFVERCLDAVQEARLPVGVVEAGLR
jgi:hypothetical protein